MRHFHRTTLTPDMVLSSAEQFFTALGLASAAREHRARGYTGTLGTVRLTVRMEGGHYTLVEAFTDQVGESRIDKNVKKFFVSLHRQSDSRHRIEAGY